MKNQGKDGSRGCVNGLALAGEIWRRVGVNREPSRKVARQLGLETPTMDGVMRICRHFRHAPSAERLAVVAMLPPDVSDSDVADWFGRSLEWAQAVRANAEKIRRREPMPAEMEYVDDGYQQGDPSPEEIYRRAAELRANPERREPINRKEPRGPYESVSERCSIRSFKWNRRHASFVCNIAD